MAPSRGNPNVLTVGVTGRGFCPCWEVLPRCAQSRAHGQDFLYDNAHSLGHGAPKQVNKSAFCRLDYSVSQYAATPTFSCPGATPDVVSMTYKEDLFPLGFGVRF